MARVGSLEFAMVGAYVGAVVGGLLGAFIGAAFFGGALSGPGGTAPVNRDTEVSALKQRIAELEREKRRESSDQPPNGGSV
jgi:hypothetical protein